MRRLSYPREELEAEVDYLEPHIECELKLHGGFDDKGQYISPRTKYRWPAVNAWAGQLKDAGIELIEASRELLTEPNFPNVQQQHFLLRNGIAQPFWDSLTITGIIEGRGRALAAIEAPDFQKIIVEDISNTALGHMNKGLLASHGWDEGGREGSGLGGHDVMWFLIRDLIFDRDQYPIPTPPDSISREKEEREMLLIPPEYEVLLSLLMNVLMIEVRAEQAFRFYESIIGDKSLFSDQAESAALAVELVNRIRSDEAIHVAWLRVAITEFRHFKIRTVEGKEVKGQAIIDPVWEKMVHWHAIEMHKANREKSTEAIEQKILAVSNGAGLIEEFRRLAS